MVKMCKTKIMQFRVEENFYQMIQNRAASKGFTKYSDYIRDLCAQDNMDNLKVHEKLNKIIEKLNLDQGVLKAKSLNMSSQQDR